MQQNGMPVMRMCAHYTGMIGLQQTTFFFFNKSWKPHLFALEKDWTLKTYKHSFFSCSGCVCEQLNTSVTKGALSSVPIGRQLLSSESILRIVLFSI